MIEKFEPYDIGPKPWGIERVIAQTRNYLGKVLFMNAGYGGDLQYHRQKEESFYLHEGKCLVEYDSGDGELVQHVMHPGEAFHIPTGAPHRVTAIEDSIIFEVGLPVFEDRVSVAHKYPVKESTR